MYSSVQSNRFRPESRHWCLASPGQVMEMSSADACSLTGRKAPRSVLIVSGRPHRVGRNRMKRACMRERPKPHRRVIIKEARLEAPSSLELPSRIVSVNDGCRHELCRTMPAACRASRSRHFPVQHTSMQSIVSCSLAHYMGMLCDTLGPYLDQTYSQPGSMRSLMGWVVRRCWRGHAAFQYQGNEYSRFWQRGAMNV